MRWLEPGFLLNQRSHREELMDRADRIRLLEWKEREGKKRFVKKGMTGWTKSSKEDTKSSACIGRGGDPSLTESLSNKWFCREWLREQPLLILDQQDPYVGVLYGGIAMIDTASISLLDAGHRKIYVALWYIEWLVHPQHYTSDLFTLFCHGMGNHSMEWNYWYHQ